MPRLFPGDVELGKRDDDHATRKKVPLGLAWQQRRLPHGPRKRSIFRVVGGILALVFLYYFFKNMPTDLENPRPRPNYSPPSGPNAPVSKQAPASQNPRENPEEAKHDFNGPIKFYHLASTLHTLSRSAGSDLTSNTVLFAAASLKSAAILLPIACDMGIRGRSYVHFALIGRDDIDMDILKSVNGITEECNILFHDARPDFSVQSTDYRMEVSVSAAFNHINTFVHPAATFVDASGEEELWFLKGLKHRATELDKTIIDLPENSEQNLMWICMLDAASLRAWNQVSIDIVVHAQPSASGSLIRLLESLKKSDFFSSAPPRLTIELPHDIDEPSRQYLEKFRWPPDHEHNSGNMLTLHHRIPQYGLTSEENSIRLLESFWPAEPLRSHVLVLSPQAELSPLFFHYLKYNMLEYKYSSSRSTSTSNIMAISLDIPSTYLNDSSEFSPPFGLTKKHEVTPFLWQAPNSNAALYFGDKWVELHDFVAQLLASQHSLPTPTSLNDKLVSKTYPSWLEHVLKLARARGYWTIYPNFENQDSLVTLHNDLYRPPEEYAEELQTETEAGELTADPAHHLSLKHTEASLITKSLLSILPAQGTLPSLLEMPLLSWDGDMLNIGEISELAFDYSTIFRREIGGCQAETVAKQRLQLKAGDLFCLNDPEPKETSDSI